MNNPRVNLLAFFGGVALTLVSMWAAHRFYPTLSMMAGASTTDGGPVVPEVEVWTLYRTSPFGSELKVHVGTFDASAFAGSDDNSKHNHQVCDDTRMFYQENALRPDGVSFWCEQGRSHAK